MNLKFYSPKSKTLKKYIKGYYFILADSDCGPLYYRTFPNNYTIVTVMQNMYLKQIDQVMTITPSEEKNIFSNIVYRYKTPIDTRYQKPVNEITIYFKPLGLNLFVDRLQEFYSKDHTREIEFDPFIDFKATMEEIFRIENREKQIEELENYWLSKLAEKDFSMMRALIEDIENDEKIDEVAKKHKISRQYLNKLFQKNIGKSPSEYRKIHRFRKSIADADQVKNLTELSYENMFYDQSHFIKDFKELTRKSPTLFFKMVDTERENVWLSI